MDTLFELPPAAAIPATPKPGALTYQDRRRLNALAGLHPLNGLPLYIERDDPMRTCGECSHCYIRQCDSRRNFHKCDTEPETGGRATDLRLDWPACEKFKPRSTRDPRYGRKPAAIPRP